MTHGNDFGTVSTAISAAIFLTTFGLILAERVHRTVIGLFGAVTMVAAGMFFGFYSPAKALHSVDFNTIGLLLGMMIVVAILEHTGFFQYLAIYAAKKTRGDPWKLTVVLGTVTTVVSLILDNVTTVVLIAPVTIIIAQILKISAVPILMAEALLSDTGGVATLVGDPPNIMIGSAAPFTFNDFLVHIAPIVVVAWFLTLWALKFVFRRELAIKPANVEALLRMDENAAMKDWTTCKIVLAVLGLVVVLFFFHHSFHMPPSMVALVGASLCLILITPTRDPQPILEKVEWSVLLFFAALFIIVGGLEHAGILGHLATQAAHLASGNLVVAAVTILWVSAIMSAAVDNIPFTMAMIPVIQHLEAQGVPVNILWWSLALGVGFGGNGTPIGSTANVVVVAKSEQTDDPITFVRWFKSGSIAMIVTCMVGMLALILFPGWLSGPYR